MCAAQNLFAAQSLRSVKFFFFQAGEDKQLSPTPPSGRRVNKRKKRVAGLCFSCKNTALHPFLLLPRPQISTVASPRPHPRPGK
jgi:hypothetical protein